MSQKAIRQGARYTTSRRRGSARTRPAYQVSYPPRVSRPQWRYPRQETELDLSSGSPETCKRCSDGIQQLPRKWRARVGQVVVAVVGSLGKPRSVSVDPVIDPEAQSARFAEVAPVHGLPQGAEVGRPSCSVPSQRGSIRAQEKAMPPQQVHMLSHLMEMWFCRYIVDIYHACCECGPLDCSITLVVYRTVRRVADADGVLFGGMPAMRRIWSECLTIRRVGRDSGPGVRLSRSRPSPCRILRGRIHVSSSKNVRGA